MSSSATTHDLQKSSFLRMCLENGQVFREQERRFGKCTAVSNEERSEKARACGPGWQPGSAICHPGQPVSEALGNEINSSYPQCQAGQQGRWIYLQQSLPGLTKLGLDCSQMKEHPAAYCFCITEPRVPAACWPRTLNLRRSDFCETCGSSEASISPTPQLLGSRGTLFSQ